VDSVPEAYRDERFKRFCKQFKESLITKNGALNTQVGNSYINFELKNPEGNKILFSDIVEKNKYTLLDFWASWCGPCRKAMPQIKEIYEKYDKKGLAVVSLSLDTDGEAWKKAIDELGMTWTQLCNPDGGSREVGQAYGIEFIPTMLIISQDGKIAARGLEGEALAKKIEELMK
jgi:thiol-disulfide isomerase/thioredoxin